MLTDKIKLWADPHFDQTGETKGGAISLTYDRFIVTANWHPFDVWGNTDDYDPIMKRFTVSKKMEADPFYKKDDQEKDAEELVHNWNNKK